MNTFKKLYDQLEKKKSTISICVVALTVIVMCFFYNTLLYQYFETEYRRLLFSRLTVVLIILLLISLSIRYRNNIYNILKGYFSATATPVNLAIFRIALFGYLLTFPNLEKLIWFSQLPRELIFEPTGFKWILQYLPISPDITVSVYKLFLIFCFMAMIGIWTRFSALMTVILGLYVLGLPQFFGKVSHYHHLLWFSMIMAASPCGDFFSVDAILKGFRRADSGNVSIPEPSMKYALPIRLIWILIGMIYFFPGIWKIWGAGFDWALGENIKYQLYSKWTELENWSPLFRIDQYPILYRLTGIGTLVFEVGFIFCLFNPILRGLFAVSGIMFHAMTELFMHICFIYLSICYVIFLNWNKIFTWIGQILFRQTAHLIYDGNCKLCRRTICVLQGFDIFQRVYYINAFNKKRIDESGLNRLDLDETLKDMHLAIGNKQWKGYYAYRTLALRMPLLWPLLPFMYIWPVTWIGGKIYRSVANSRLCHVAYKSVARREFHELKPKRELWPIILVGAFLILGNVGYGFLKLNNGWPLSCYPTFSFIARDSISTLELSAVDKNGNEKKLDVHGFSQNFSSSRFHCLFRSILRKREAAKRDVRIEALATFWKNHDPKLKDFKQIRVYRIKNLIDPAYKDSQPLSKELIYEMAI